MFTPWKFNRESALSAGATCSFGKSECTEKGFGIQGACYTLQALDTEKLLQFLDGQTHLHFILLSFAVAGAKAAVQMRVFHVLQQRRT